MNAIIKNSLLTVLAVGICFASSANASERIEKVAESTTSCTVGDGYQTVNFPNGSVYKGYFKSCVPQSGSAYFRHEGTILNGYAEVLNSDTVRLTSGEHRVTLRLVTRTASR